MKNLLCICYLLGTLGCIDDKVYIEESGEKSEIFFSFELPSDEDMTRGMSVADQTVVNNIRVLVFKPTGEYLYTAAGTLDNSNPNTTSYQKYFTVKLEKATAVDLLVVVNAATEVSNLSLLQGDSRSRTDIQTALTVSETGQWNVSNPIPMYGTLRNIPINTTTGTATTPLQITMIRMLARIDVSLHNNLVTDGYKIARVYLYNRQTKGRIIPEDINWPNLGNPAEPVNAPTSPDTSWETNRATQSLLYTVLPETTNYTSEIYLFEALNKQDENYLKRPGMVIGITQNGNPNIAYYRADFKEAVNNKDKYLDIQRNHCYQYQVVSITGPGLDDPDEAWKAIAIEIDATITTWEKGYDYSIDLGPDHFILSQTYLELPGYSLSIGKEIYINPTIGVSSTRNWIYQWSTSPTIVTGNVNWIKTQGRWNNTPDDTFYFTLEDNTTGDKRIAYLHFITDNDNLRHVATIIQRRGTYPNCYFIQPGKTIEIPVQKAWIVWTDPIMGINQLSESQLNGTITTEVIWQDSPQLVNVSISTGTGNSTRLKISALNATRQGNAVVGIRINGILRYSWHIWVTDYDPDEGGKVYVHNNGFKDYQFMDRNLGATAALPTGDNNLATHGLHYQWGRKDPFPGSAGVEQLQSTTTHKMIYMGQSTSGTTNAVTNTVVNNTNNIANSIGNILTFYYGGNMYDWYTTSGRNDYLWWDTSERKGLFDPCPDGWRVPIYTTVNGETSFIWSYKCDDPTCDGYGDIVFHTNMYEFGQAGSHRHEFKSGNLIWTSNGYMSRRYGGYFPAAGRRYSSGVGDVGEQGSYWGIAFFTGNQPSFISYVPLTNITKRDRIGGAPGEVQYGISISDYGNREVGASVRCVRDE